MADTSIHKPIIVKGWTISPSGAVFQAVNKHGERIFAHPHYGTVETWCKNSTNDSSVRHQ